MAVHVSILLEVTAVIALMDILATTVKQVNLGIYNKKKNKKSFFSELLLLLQIISQYFHFNNFSTIVRSKTVIFCTKFYFGKDSTLEIMKKKKKNGDSFSKNYF